jgi:hypothetical protein
MANEAFGWQNHLDAFYPADTGGMCPAATRG